MNYKKGKKYTRSIMVEKRKKILGEYNKTHFKLKIKGVNGEDISLFHNGHKEWWKNKNSYIENPKCISQGQLLEDKKLHCRNESMLLADFTVEEAPKG